MYAQTDIKYGDPSGNMVEFAQGDEVTGLPDDAVEALVEAGALADQPPLQTHEQVGDFVAAKDAEIERLKALLAEHGIEDEAEPEAEPEAEAAKS